jgi:hypothetical protein
MNPLYPQVAQRARRRCEYCRAPEEVFNFPFEVEHLFPQSRGGSDELDNLALSCHACNRFKSDFTTGYDAVTQQETLLFHPRHDVWSEHFRVDTETFQIVGLTPAGRATITRLQMNRHAQMNARRRWLQLSLFP